MSRKYLEQKISLDSHFQYSEPDLLEIARAQHQAELSEVNKKPSLVICDTDLLVMIIWSEVRFGHCHPWIHDTFKQQITEQPRHYLLCDYDVPWEPDTLRESADSRDSLFALYQQKMDFLNLHYDIIKGSVTERVEYCTSLLSGNMPRH